MKLSRVKTFHVMNVWTRLTDADLARIGEETANNAKNKIFSLDCAWSLTIGMIYLCTVASKEASSKRMAGDFPPSSSVTRFILLLTANS